MKKKQFKKKWIVMIVLVAILIGSIGFWGVSILKCESLTADHKAEFQEASTEIAGVMRFDDWKVLKYGDGYAEVYYYADGGGAVISYDKINGEWTERDWEAVWSATGTADDVVWPYIR